MGHERTGTLPKTAQWRQLVSDFGLTSGSSKSVVSIADRTLENVRDRFKRIHADTGVQAAFGFLVGLASNDLPPTGATKAAPPIDLRANPSPVGLARGLNDWVDLHDASTEYAALAKRAGSEAIAAWVTSRTRQHDLFGSSLDAETIWSGAGTGAGFSEISRVFLANFVERYIKYFLEREASAEFANIDERNEFGFRLEEQLDALSHHAFDSAQITQSFAAGWLNKRIGEQRRPTDDELEAFLAFAFSKLRQELQREGEG